MQPPGKKPQIQPQQKSPFTTTPELEEWLLEAADKPITPLTSADFDSIRERALARSKSSPGRQ